MSNAPVFSKEEILENYEYDVHYYGGGRKHVLEAMEIFAKQESIEFFKWNAAKAAEYINYITRVSKSEGNSEYEKELDIFENSTIEQRYNLFTEQRNKQG